MTSFSYIFLLEILCAGAWEDWSAWLVDHMQLALCGVQWLWNSPFFWQAGTLCLLGTCPNLQTPHLTRKTRKCLYGGSWQFLGGIKPDWPLLALHCTIHLHCSYLAWSLWEGQSGLTPHLIGACKILQIFPRLCLRSTHLMASSRTHIGPCQNLLTRPSLSCISGTQVMLQAHIPKYFHISSAILKIYDKAHY